MNRIISETIERLNESSNIEHLSNCFEALIQKLGFSSFTYVAARLPSVKTDEPIVQTKYNPEWVKRYIDKNYQFQDPVALKGIRSRVPFDWTEVAQPNSIIMNEGAEFGYSAGITVPIHANFGEFALLSATLDGSGIEQNKITNTNLPHFQFIAFHYHRRLVEILSTEPSSPIKLTARETEVLKWTAQGKTAWEIAAILNLAERTINQYVQSSMKKLNVFNKQHAIAKALVMGLITI